MTYEVCSVDDVSTTDGFRNERSASSRVSCRRPSISSIPMSCLQAAMPPTSRRGGRFKFFLNSNSYMARNKDDNGDDAAIDVDS